MFRISRFQEVLKLLPRAGFDRAVQRHQADKYRKGFSCWQHLVAMVYAQLAGLRSLRTLQGGFNAHATHHYHLGCRSLRRSTLADANAHSEGAQQVFSEIAQQLMQRVRGAVRTEGEELLRLLDSTSVTLKGPGFDEWCAADRTRYTQGVKLHVLFGLNEQAPLAQAITAANLNDIEYAHELAIEPGAVYVFDKGYCNYRWWWRMHQSRARFVTRFKRNARLCLVQERTIAKAAQGIILSDRHVRLSSPKRGQQRNPYTAILRRIEIHRAGKAPLVLATNDLKSSALKIAERYRARWQIELFFKWIKQHLHIKCFFGRSQRAVRIQILAALIAYLLVVLYAQAQRLSASLWLLLNELRATLFQRSHSDYHRQRRWRLRRSFFQFRQQRLFA